MAKKLLEYIFEKIAQYKAEAPLRRQQKLEQIRYETELMRLRTEKSALEAQKRNYDSQYKPQERREFDHFGGFVLNPQLSHNSSKMRQYKSPQFKPKVDWDFMFHGNKKLRRR